MLLATAHVKLMTEFLKERADGYDGERKEGYLEALEDLSGLIIAQITNELEKFEIEAWETYFKNEQADQEKEG